jgi:hypothetical protein
MVITDSVWLSLFKASEYKSEDNCILSTAILIPLFSTRDRMTDVEGIHYFIANILSNFVDIPVPTVPTQ